MTTQRCRKTKKRQEREWIVQLASSHLYLRFNCQWCCHCYYRRQASGSGWEPEILRVTAITGYEWDYRSNKNHKGVTGTDVPESSRTCYIHGPPGFQQPLSLPLPKFDSVDWDQSRYSLFLTSTSADWCSRPMSRFVSFMGYFSAESTDGFLPLQRYNVMADPMPWERGGEWWLQKNLTTFLPASHSLREPVF